MTRHPDLNRFLLDYCAAFRAGNITEVTGFYHLPATMIFEGQVSVINSAQALANMLQNIIDKLLERGFCQSRVDEYHIHQLTDETALLSASFSRLKTDNTVLERLGATYTVVKDGEAFKIAALIAHDPKSIIKA